MPPRKATTTEDNKSRFASLGFSAVTAPASEMPKMPARLSVLSAAELSDHINLYAAWREYAEDLLRAQNAVLTRLSEERDRVYAQLLIGHKGGKDKITETKYKVLADPSYARINKQYVEEEVYRDMLASKVESFTNCLDMLSREITLRGIGMR